MNDILWEKELCDSCLDDLEAFLAAEPGDVPEQPTEPDTPDPSEPSENPDGDGDDGGETSAKPGAGGETPTP